MRLKAAEYNKYYSDGEKFGSDRGAIMNPGPIRIGQGFTFEKATGQGHRQPDSDQKSAFSGNMFKQAHD